MTSSDESRTGVRPDPSDELRQVALERFASVGYAGTSLQQIADIAGYSKSSVLYHFDSKEALLEAALTPTLESLENILLDAADALTDRAHRERFVARFVDFLLKRRLEVHIFINQAQSLAEVPIIARASEIVRQLGERVASNVDTTLDRVRFGVALGGAAYTLVASDMFGELSTDEESMRQALTSVMTSLLATTTNDE